MDRADVDDPPPTALDHDRQCGLDEHERRRQHGREDGVPSFEREFDHRRNVLEPGAIDQDVEPSVSSDDILDQGPAGLDFS